LAEDSDDINSFDCIYVHSDEQKSIGLKFSKSRTGSHVTYNVAVLLESSLPYIY